MSPDDVPGQPGSEPPRARSEFAEAVEAARRAMAAKGSKPSKSRTKARLPYTTAKDELTKGAIKLRDMTQTSALRNRLATFAIVAVSVQLLVANVFFGYYLWKTQAYGFDASVMIAWLSATVVEVVGIVVIVARNLFPSTAAALRRKDIKRIVKAIRASE